MAKMKPVKMKICKFCGKEFAPIMTMAKCCSPKCAIEYNRMLDHLKKKKEYKKETRRLKENIKTKAQWMREAQTEFNKYIRERDHDQPCISCGRHHQGQYHAGHYRTTKACPELRFHESNCFKQCQPCNTMLSGNITEFRINLVKKIGTAMVEWIEGGHYAHKYTIEDLQGIKQLYKDKYKYTKSANESFDDWRDGLG